MTSTLDLLIATCSCGIVAAALATIPSESDSKVLRCPEELKTERETTVTTT